MIPLLAKSSRRKRPGARQRHGILDACGREHDACFSSMSPFPAVGASAACRGWIPRPPDVPNSLVAGKKAGNFFDSTALCVNPSRKHLRMQWFADEFPTQTEQGIFLPGQGINSREHR